ncbi:MAG: hypothetical protein LV473_22725 [Nitrospira sp.]|nr:hypothetical protein [Nitrospira sp.]
MAINCAFFPACTDSISTTTLISTICSAGIWKKELVYWELLVREIRTRRLVED